MTASRHLRSIGLPLWVILAGLMAGACQISRVSLQAPSESDAQLTPTESVTPSPAPSSTSIPRPTSTATSTPEPTSTPTPFGGIGLDFIYSDADYNLVRYDEGPLFTRSQVEESLGRSFESLIYYPSPDLSKVLIRGYNNRPGFLPHWFVSPIDLSYVKSVGTGYRRPTWSPDSSRLLVINENESIFVVSSDVGSQRSIGIRYPTDGIPAWLNDSSKIYWTRNGESRVIDVETGRSEQVAADWLDDSVQVFIFERSPLGDRIAFQNHYLIEGRKLYIAKSDFTDPVAISLDREGGLSSYIAGLFWSPAGEALVAYMITYDMDCSEDCTEASEYHLVDPSSAKMTRLPNLERAIENVEPYHINCGLTPDGRNFLVNNYGSYYFFDLMSGELALEIGSPLSCPVWLPGE